MIAHAKPSRIFPGLPPHRRGQKIGLYGGSFNPAHQGHRQASLLALRRLDLDRIWWLVTPGNPLKDTGSLPPFDVRLSKAAAVAANPRIEVTAAEALFGTTYTADFIRVLTERSPDVCFVWIMGSDNLAELHRWERWRDIAERVPIAVVNRPGWLSAALSAPAAQAFAHARIDEQDARVLACREPPAWTFLVGPRISASSTALRSGSAVS